MITCGHNHHLNTEEKCYTCYSRDYYHKHNQKLRAAARQRYKKSDKERFRFAHAKCRHGVTPKEWKKIQSIKSCQICGRKFPTPRSKQIDHDHIDNHIRGVLCNKCNSALGTFGDTIEGLQRAMDYLLLDLTQIVS
jgi:hypothetical protein